MFVEIRYKTLYMETYMVKQIISPPIKLFTLPEILFASKETTKFFPGMGAAMTIFSKGLKNEFDTAVVN